MATLQFVFRLDAEVGQKVKEVSERLGISATDAFRMFAYAYVQSGGFPFPIRLNQEKRESVQQSRIHKNVLAVKA